MARGSAHNSLRRLPVWWERSLLGVILLLPNYPLYALKWFPTWDGWHTYGFYHFVISSLSDGHLPYWNPRAACGSPFFHSIVKDGLLEPTFLLSVASGKLLSLDILQIFSLWCSLRIIPFSLGLYWLLKQLTRHSAISLAGTAFLSVVFFTCHYRDFITYCIYFPLLAATLLHLARSLRAERPSLPALYGCVLFFCISALIYNPAYVAVYLTVLAVCSAVFFPKATWKSLAGLRSIRWKHRAGVFLLGLLLLSPAVAILYHNDPRQHFPYVRNHSAFLHNHVPYASHNLSTLLEDPIPILEKDPRFNPVRDAREWITCAFPIHYSMYPKMEGPSYFGFLGLAGIAWGAVFLRSRALFSCLSASFAVFLLMTPWANSFIQTFSPALPFLKILNQRHLLYPVYLLLATLSGAIGLRLLLVPGLMRKVAPHAPPWRCVILGAAFLGVCHWIVWATWRDPYDIHFLARHLRETVRDDLLFLAGLWFVAFSSRAAVRRPSWFPVHAAGLAAIAAIDLFVLFNSLSREYNRDKGIFAGSAWVREPAACQYQAYRTPLLPLLHGTVVHSLQILIDLRTALPAYWHCGAMFTTQRYYEVFGLLDAERLGPVLGLTQPILRLCPQGREIAPGEDALAILKAMAPEDIGQTVVLEPARAPKTPPPDLLSERAFSGAPLRPHGINLPPSNTALRERIDKTLYPSLFDRRESLLPYPAESAGNGVFHLPLFRIAAPERFFPASLSSQEIASRYLFPDFPTALDRKGTPIYVSEDENTLLQIAPGKGLVLEWNGRGQSPTLPREVLYQKKRDAKDTRLRVTRFHPARIEIGVDLAAPAVLTYADVFDKNWTASIDGRETCLYIANHAFKAVRVPAGKHSVSFRYRLWALDVAIGLYFSGIGLCVSAFAWALRPTFRKTAW